MSAQWGGRTGRRTWNDPEHQLQAELVAWAALEQNRHPELALLHAIPNGGKRTIRVAAKMRAEGQKAGVPDLFLPVARSGLHGLYLETKVDTRVPRIRRTAAGERVRLERHRTDLSAEQVRWKAMLEGQGYGHRTYRSLDEGRGIILAYLAGRLPAEDRHHP